MFCLNVGVIMELYTNLSELSEILYYIGAIYISVSFLYTGMIFAKTHITFSKKHIFIFIIPVISTIMILTNSYHHLFIENYSLLASEKVNGIYFLIHTIYSYACLVVGLYYFIYFSIKNSGFFSQQSVLILIGTLISIVVDSLSTFSIWNGIIYVENIAFAVTVGFYLLAIIRYKFLDVLPIALQKVVDNISDGFVVINGDYEVIDYNRTFIKVFKDILNINRKDNFFDIIYLSERLKPLAKDLKQRIEEAITKKESVNFETNIKSDPFDLYFDVEITSIMSGNTSIGILILLKDITEIKKNLQQIHETQKRLLERERLASLGELIGGVAHDINSPLSSLQNFAKEISNLTNEYKDLQGELDATTEDFNEIVGEIDDKIIKIQNLSNRIANIVNSVRNHTRNLSNSNYTTVEFRTVIEDLRVLLGHELKQSNCQLIYNEDKSTILEIDHGKLGQVMTNLITNAIQSYGGNPGTIEVEVKNLDNNILIKVKDEGIGIDSSIKDEIFKEILTTKGSKGTGLGLYISYAIVTGHLEGKMWFESEQGKGTSFYILIPKHNSNTSKK